MNEEKPTADECPKCFDSKLSHAEQVKLVGRHCLECGWSRPLVEEPKVSDAKGTPEMLAASQRNRQGFVLLLQRYPGIVIPQKSFDEWRACEVTAGYIRGLEHLGILDCLATDGLQGLFVNMIGEPMLGHVECFDWNEPVVSYVPYIKPSGEVGYFKSVKDHGAPGSLHKVPRNSIKEAPIRKKKEKSKRQKLLDSL